MADRSQAQQQSGRLLPWRFGMFLALTLAIPALMLAGVSTGTAVLGGYSLAALAFVLSTWPLFSDEAEEMRRDAQRNDAGRPLALGITLVAPAPPATSPARAVLAPFRVRVDSCTAAPRSFHLMSRPILRVQLTGDEKTGVGARGRRTTKLAGDLRVHSRATTIRETTQ